MTVFAFVLILIILIPVLAIVIDSPVGQALARRISAEEEEQGSLGPRVETLEGEVRYLNETVESLKEESEFLHSLIEGKGDAAKRLEPPESPPGSETGS